MLRKIFTINEKTSLNENAAFWFWILLPIFLACLFSIPMASNLNFDFSPEGYAYFLELFKFPLWVCSGSILFGVMIGRFHGSKQRAATISQSISQNNFTNYLNHRDHFQKYMQNLSQDSDLKIDPFTLYGIVFSNSTPSQADTIISKKIFEHYEKTFNEEFLDKLKNMHGSYSTQEVNIYFPRLLQRIGINSESITVSDFNQTWAVLLKTRKIYRRAMEYGLSRNDATNEIEIEESGFAMLNGQFSEWAQENGFKAPWQ